MTIDHISNTIKETMKLLEDVDLISLQKKKDSQMKINKAYNILEDLRKELVKYNK